MSRYSDLKERLKHHLSQSDDPCQSPDLLVGEDWPCDVAQAIAATDWDHATQPEHSNLGWFVDKEVVGGVDKGWSIFLQATPGLCVELADLSFDSQEQAQAFMRESVLDQGPHPKYGGQT